MGLSFVTSRCGSSSQPPTAHVRLLLGLILRLDNPLGSFGEYDTLIFDLVYVSFMAKEILLRLWTSED